MFLDRSDLASEYDAGREYVCFFPVLVQNFEKRLKNSNKALQKTQHMQLSLQNEVFWFAMPELKLAAQCSLSPCG